MNTATNDANTDAWLTLLRTPGLGPATCRTLCERYGNATHILQALRGAEGITLSAAARAWLAQPDASLLAQDRAWLDVQNHHLVTWNDNDFPALLREIPSAPAALFIDGDPMQLWAPQIAIVGSRNASASGLATAKSFAQAFAHAGFTVTSGLADGIDGIAHSAAMDANGMTIAVLGTGADVIYPNKHHALALRVAAQGALVSEFSPGTAPRAEHFPRRNRIISGLALGTLVIEASLRSGSLITARLAMEQGREVFAIPGSIHNPMARGCHRLIRDGAKLVETAEEVISELAPLAGQLGAQLRQRLAMEAIPTTIASTTAPHRDADYTQLLKALDFDALNVDQLAERSGLSVSTLSSMLLVLELEGEVTAGRGGTYCKTQKI